MSLDTFAKQIRYTTVRIETDAGTGTGFFYNISPRLDKPSLVLVTNKHVVKDATTGRIRLLKREADLPSREPIELQLPQGSFEDNWYGHPDPDIDVAVLPVAAALEWLRTGENVDVFVAAASPGLCPTEDVVAGFDAIETVTFVGYPNGLIDEYNHTPIVRQGITATPVAEDFNGKPIMLIDASVFPGSSGSPVFIIYPGARFSAAAPSVPGIGLGSACYFIGVVAQVYLQPDSGEIIPVSHMLKIQTRQFIDLGIVYKWPTIEQTIDAMCVARGIDRASLESVVPPVVNVEP